MINNKGFSIIGVLVASLIGLIITGGMVRLFANMSSQMKKIDQKSQRVFLRDLIGDVIGSSCEEAFRPFSNSLFQGNNIAEFPQINTSGGAVAVDLTDKDKLRQDYGMDGHVYFKLECAESGSPPNCDCSQTGTPYPCVKKWSLSLISQSFVNNLPQYNRNMKFPIIVTYDDLDSNGSVVSSEFSCRFNPIAGGGGGGGSLDQADIDDIINKAVDKAKEETIKEIKDKHFHITSIGENAGTPDKSKNNVHIGNNAGKENTGGIGNTLIGTNAGKKNTSSGNTFIGYNTGEQFTGYGSNNTFIGNKAGKKLLGSTNIAIGNDAGGDAYNTGHDNIVIGNNARTTGGMGSFSDNIIIGHDAFATGNKQLAIGYSSGIWIKGSIGGSSLKVGGAETVNASSRTLKKKIKPYKDFKKALEDILQTPLFTYHYKEKARHPKKKRMGIIAEELPDHLQLKSKKYPTQPDWPSIYGTFWGAIKALYEMIQSTDKKLEQEIKRIEKEIKEKSDLKIKTLSQEIKELKAKLNETQKELKELKKKDLQ